MIIENTISSGEVGRVPETLKLAELLEENAGRLLLDAIHAVSK